MKLYQSLLGLGLGVALLASPVYARHKDKPKETSTLDQTIVSSRSDAAKKYNTNIGLISQISGTTYFSVSPDVPTIEILAGIKPGYSLVYVEMTKQQYLDLFNGQDLPGDFKKNLESSLSQIPGDKVDVCTFQVQKDKVNDPKPGINEINDMLNKTALGIEEQKDADKDHFITTKELTIYKLNKCREQKSQSQPQAGAPSV